MEPARGYTPFRPDAASMPRAERHQISSASVSAVVLQVDATVSRVHGLAWLMERRDAATLTRLSELQAKATEGAWSVIDLTRARLSYLRPRRAEINALGQAYLAEMLPGVVDAVRRIRRTGIAVSIASEVATEALFGVANAIGIGTQELHGPRLRFDALGAYVGGDIAPRRVDAEADVEGFLPNAAAPRTLYVGTRQSELLAPTERDAFIAFTGVVAREGFAAPYESVDSFADLADLLAP
jgi:hypothetical protein